MQGEILVRLGGAHVCAYTARGCNMYTEWLSCHSQAGIPGIGNTTCLGVHC